MEAGWVAECNRLTLMGMNDVEVGLKAASVGASIARGRFGEERTRFAKEGTDFATDVDIAIENAILGVLREARPQDAVQGEEFGFTGPSDAERMWLVDPLCGTLNYAAGLGIYAVNVALVSGDDVLAAVVAEPSTGSYLCTDGTRAWSQTEGSEMRTELKPSASSRLVEVNLETRDPDEHGFSSSRFFRSGAFETFSPRFIGTSLPLAWVASGRYAGFVIPGYREASVHFTTGIGLCRTAGCILTGFHGEPLHLANDGIVAAADAATHEVLLSGTAEQLIDKDLYRHSN